MNAIHRHNSFPEIFLLHSRNSVHSKFHPDRPKKEGLTLPLCNKSCMGSESVASSEACRAPGPFGVSRDPCVVRSPKGLEMALAVVEIGFSQRFNLGAPLRVVSRLNGESFKWVLSYQSVGQTWFYSSCTGFDCLGERLISKFSILFTSKIICREKLTSEIRQNTVYSKLYFAVFRVFC
ncbi:hypothetical protein CDAR_418761 [Caerostris darwini]|uniref:Uncharacterized protein n=1 Tax=Caerostris darwini TaxID=1538125 RepID=A0AAV4MY70_9ARAC|nr:hypothetical protein CDAR_418761 [Caerostris darwini]